MAHQSFQNDVDDPPQHQHQWKQKKGSGRVCGGVGIPLPLVLGLLCGTSKCHDNPDGPESKRGGGDTDPRVLQYVFSHNITTDGYSQLDLLYQRHTVE